MLLLPAVVSGAAKDGLEVWVVRGRLLLRLSWRLSYDGMIDGVHSFGPRRHAGSSIHNTITLWILLVLF